MCAEKITDYAARIINEPTVAEDAMKADRIQWALENLPAMVFVVREVAIAARRFFNRVVRATRAVKVPEPPAALVNELRR